jgi:hypothetical protein
MFGAGVNDKVFLYCIESRLHIQDMGRMGHMANWAKSYVKPIYILTPPPQTKGGCKESKSDTFSLST